MSVIPKHMQHVKLCEQCAEILNNLPQGFTLKQDEVDILKSMVERKIVWGTPKQGEFVTKVRARITLYRNLCQGVNDADMFADYFEAVGFPDVATLIRINHAQQR